MGFLVTRCLRRRFSLNKIKMLPIWKQNQRCASVSKTQITPLLTLREVKDKDQVSTHSFLPQRKPLVLMFDWLYANQSALDKYCNLYHDIGLDVLTVRGKLVHFLWPPRGEEFAKGLLKYVLKERPMEEELFIHAFSVGAYNYTICKTLGLENPEEYGAFRKKVIGQIFDSIVLGSYETMSTGIASALHDSGSLTKPIIALMNMYYSATNKQTKEVYDKLVINFKEFPIVVPTLIYYSQNDPMCHVPSMEEMISTWDKDFPHFDVSVQYWDESIHAAHLKFHKEDYLKCWWNIVEKVIGNVNK